MRLLTALVAIGLSLGCGKHLYTREDLDVAVGKHHIDLRWGRLENASLLVKPEMRGAFLQSWAARLGKIEVQDMDIAGVGMHPDGDKADVVVNITYIDRFDMSVKVATIQELWVRGDSGWVVEKPAELPDQQ